MLFGVGAEASYSKPKIRALKALLKSQGQEGPPRLLHWLDNWLSFSRASDHNSRPTTGFSLRRVKTRYREIIMAINDRFLALFSRPHLCHAGARHSLTFLLQATRVERYQDKKRSENLSPVTAFPCLASWLVRY